MSADIETADKEDRMSERCEHYWAYHHGQIQGPKPSQTVVTRSCRDCGLRQMALTGPWKKATGDYARDEHYDLPFAVESA